MGASGGWCSAAGAFEGHVGGVDSARMVVVARQIGDDGLGDPGEFGAYDAPLQRVQVMNASECQLIQQSSVAGFCNRVGTTRGESFARDGAQSDALAVGQSVPETSAQP